MQAITSTSTASWGFNNLDMDAQPPMKIETIDTENNDVVMKDGDGGVDDSDSDIEIISSSVVNPSRAPQNGRPDNARRSPARASDFRSGERNGRKRADSPIELSGDESPPKKPKTHVNGNMQPTSASAARSGASRPPSQQARSPSKSSQPNHRSNLGKSPMLGGNFDRVASHVSKARPSNATSSEQRLTGEYSTPASAAAIYPPESRRDAAKDGSSSSIRLQPLSRRTTPIPSATPASANKVTNTSKAPKLGGILDQNAPPKFGRSILNKSYNYLTSTAALLKPSSSSSPQPQHRSNSRQGMPFEEDDSDEELFGKESSPSTESTAGAPTPKHEQSEPEFDNIVVATQPPLSEQTVERPANNDKNTDKSAHKAASSSRGPSYVDRIRHDSRQYSSTRKFPDTSKVLPAGENDREMAITMSKHSSSALPLFQSHSRPLESEVRTQRSVNGESGLGSSLLGKRRDDKKFAGNRPQVVSVPPDDIEKRVREEKSRKMQDDFMAKIRSTAHPQPSGEEDEARTARSESANPVVAVGPIGESVVPPKPLDEPEVRRRREEAANARKQADLRREAEASQRAREKAEAERERYQRQQQMLQARREQARQKQQQTSEEERIFAERSAAMSKLSQVKPLPPRPKKPVDDSASVSGLLATVSSRKERVPLHQDDEPEKGIASSLGYGDDPSKETATSQGSSQKENLEPTPTSVPASQLAALRELRIREKQERNERMRAAERKEEERRRIQEQRDSQLSRDPGHSPVPKGPVSLNSIAGQRLLSESKTVPRKLGQGQQPDIESPQRSRDRKLGELREDDVQVLQWKDTMGMKWPEVLQLYNRKYSRSWMEGTLKNRYFQARKAIGLAEISDDQWDNLTAGCEETRLEVNRMINGDAFQMGQTSPRHGPKIHLQPKAVHWDPNISHSTKVDSSSSEQSPPPQAPQDHEDPYDRQSKGGKTMNANTFYHYLEHIAEKFTKNEEDMEDRAAREPSPFDPDDYTPFMYQVQRRELDQDAIDAGDDIDEEAWTTCGDTNGFDTAHEANLATYQELFTNREGALSRADLSKGRVHSTEIIEGMEFHELRGKNGGGLRQVRVARSLRSLGKGSMPRNKVGWTPRTTYVVKQRTIVDSKSPPPAPEKDRKEDAEKSDDQAVDPELFGEEMIPETLPEPEPEPQPISTRTTDTSVLEGTYTILELANMAAVKEFVKATFKPKSTNLGLRGFEIQEEEERLLKDLDEDDFFSQKAEAEFEFDEGKGGEGTLEIWVEESELRGPRNLD